MFCTKCGANNEDGNAFCKNCGAKLVKPAVNSPVPSSSGVAQAAKAVNVKLIVGIAAAVIVVVMVIGVLMNVGKGGKTLFEQVEFGKTTLTDVKEYFNKNNLGWDWGTDELNDVPSWLVECFMEQEGIRYLSERCKREGYKYDLDIVVDNALSNGGNFYISDHMFLTDDTLMRYLDDNTLHHNTNLQDILWGAGCRYFLPISGDVDDNEKKRTVSSMFCVVDVRDESAKREFKEGLDKYIEKHQKTNLESKYVDYEYDDIHLIIYPLEKTTINGEKSLTCLVYDYSNLERNGYIFMELCYETYFIEEDLKNIMSEVTPYDDEDFYAPDNYTVYHNQYIGWYFGFTLNEMYPEFQKAEFEAIQKEASDFECSIDVFSNEEKGIVIEGCKSDKSDIVIPESIHDYPVKKIADNAFSGCSNLKSIQIPDSVEYIGSNAFSGCSSLTEITLPSGITEIKDNTFSGCGSLTDVKIPSTVTIIGDKAFENCGSLVNINIDNNITVIADHAFDGCDVLVSVELNTRFPNVVPKPAWLEAYRGYGDNAVCIVGTDNAGIPYLAVNYNGLYHYDGNGVEECTYLQDAYYNLNNNKLLIFQSGKSYSLIDLYTCNTELACSSYYDYNSDSMIYTDMNGTEISEDEYTRIYNEIMNQMGKRSEDECYMQFYSSIDEAFQAYISNGGSTSASGSASATNTSESADTALATDNSTSDNINIDVESEVKQIRQWYNDTQNGLDNLMYSQYGDDIEYYFELGYAVKSIIPSGYDGWDYTRQYFYKDQKLYFAFVFKGSEEYRVYFKDGKVIRYIDNNGTVFDYGNIGDGEQLGQKIIAESDKLYPEFNCGA